MIYFLAFRLEELLNHAPSSFTCSLVVDLKDCLTTWSTAITVIRGGTYARPLLLSLSGVVTECCPQGPLWKSSLPPFLNNPNLLTCRSYLSLGLLNRGGGGDRACFLGFYGALVGCIWKRIWLTCLFIICVFKVTARHLQPLHGKTKKLHQH